MPATNSHHSRCAVHPSSRAGWFCQGCERRLCPACVGVRKLNNGEAELCVHCGGLADRIMQARRIEPYWEMFPRFLGSMFSLDGLLQLLAIGLFLYFIPWIPIIGKLLAFAAYVSYVFRVISYTAAGHERLPEPDDFLGWESIFPVIFRFILASAIVWVPAFAYAVFVIGPTAIELMDVREFLDPVLALLIVAGVAYFPAALIVAAVAESALAVVNPMITVRLMLRIPGQYALTIFVWLVLTALGIGMETAAGLLIPLPIFRGIFQEIVGLIAPVLVAFVFGRLVYQNGEHFGVYRIGELVEPEWPDAKPTGRLRDDTHAERGRVHGTSIDVPGWESEVGADPMLGAQPALQDDGAFSVGPLPTSNLEPHPGPAGSAGPANPVDADGRLAHYPPSDLELDDPAGPARGSLWNQPPPRVVEEQAFAPAESGSISLDLAGPSHDLTAPTQAGLASEESVSRFAPSLPSSAGWSAGGTADLTVRAPTGAVRWHDDDEGATDVELFEQGPPAADMPEILGPVTRGGTPVSPPAFGSSDPALGSSDLPLGSSDLPSQKHQPEAGPNAAGGFFATAIASPKAELRGGSGGSLIADLETPAPGAQVARTYEPSRKPTVQDAWSGGALLEPEAAPASEDASPPETAIRVALRSGEDPEVLKAFDDAPPADGDLDAREWLRLCGMLERAGRSKEAVRSAQRALAADPYGPFAPRAMFTMGRVLEERLDRAEKARGVFESLIKHFPQDDFSQRAREALRRLGSRA